MVGVADHLAQVSNSEVIQYSATGFRDFTRIAASDPTMWRDVFLTNKDAVLDILGRFAEELFVLQRAIRMGDGPRTRHVAPDFRAVVPDAGARRDSEARASDLPGIVECSVGCLLGHFGYSSQMAIPRASNR
jgi:hypothetical protein